MHLVLGCGDVGFALVSRLKEGGAEPAVIDRDPKKVKLLKGMGLSAFLGDFSSPDVLKGAGIESAEVVLVMAPNFGDTELALGAVNELKAKLNIDPVVVVRVQDEAEIAEAKRLGASDALPSSQILADFALSRFQELKAMAKEKRLRALIQGLRGRMAIVLQTNPDPDGIASGVALRSYAKAFGIDADIVYDGIIGHPQNRALVNLLELNPLLADKVDFRSYMSFALVDVATHANCALPEGILPTIVIDHHPVPASEVMAVFKDIEIVGSTSTLLTNYLRYGAVGLDGATAAALIIGILTDTMNFTRGAKPTDFEAMKHLMKLADVDLLGRLQSPAISPEALEVLAQAIKGSKLQEGYLITNVGQAKDRDLVAQAADFMLKREGVTTSLAYGICGDMVYVSARTNNVALHLGQTLKEAFAAIGSAGGHARMAGATIPLKAFGKVRDERALRAGMNRMVRQKFLEVVGVLKPKVKRTRAELK